MTVHQIIDKILKGDIPSDIATKAAYITELNRISSNLTPVTAVLIASSRIDHFGEDSESINKWTAWVHNEFGFQKHYIYHLRAVGLMLLDFHKIDSDVFTKLVNISLNKSISISSLPREKVSDFLTENDVQNMDQDEVREAVAIAKDGRRKKDAKKKKNTGTGFNPDDMYQPEFDFISAVCEAATWDETRTEQFAQDERVDAWISARSGLSLLDVAIRKLEAGHKIDAEDRQSIIDTLEEDIRQIKSVS